MDRNTDRVLTEHPYKSQPARAFWSKAVAAGFDARDALIGADPLIRRDDLVVSAGSCFASNLVPYLEGAGYTYLRTERVHPAFAHLPEDLGYRNFSAAYGNIYTTRQLRQLLERALGTLRPVEDRWHVDGFVVDPFRPGLRYPAQSDAEFDALTDQHLRAVRMAFEQATVIVFTLGLTEAWESSADGAVFPACPGTISGTFNPGKHRFHNFTAAEVRDDLVAFVRQVRALNPLVRLILTVSPVPLVATATREHVLVASTYSKAVLRVAANDVAATERGVVYFPAFEIVSGPQAPATYYEEDKRNVSEEGVNAVMEALLASCEGANRTAADGASAVDTPVGPTPGADGPPPRSTAQPFLSLSEALAQAECDEAMSDVG